MSSPYDWPEAIRAAFLAAGAPPESADHAAERVANDVRGPWLGDDEAAEVIAEDRAWEDNAALDRYREKRDSA